MFVHNPPFYHSQSVLTACTRMLKWSLCFPSGINTCDTHQNLFSCKKIKIKWLLPSVCVVWHLFINWIPAGAVFQHFSVYCFCTRLCVFLLFTRSQFDDWPHSALPWAVAGIVFSQCHGWAHTKHWSNLDNWPLWLLNTLLI